MGIVKKPDGTYEIDCPILKRVIGQDDCMEICFVAESMFKETILPEEVRQVESFREICLACENHPD